jgi:NAD(P)H dehydrogenase (quinone)
MPSSVCVRYTCPLLFKLDEVHGGSAYGSSFLAGPDGSRQVSETELAIAEHHVRHPAAMDGRRG